jgi:hypothetical protein
MLGSDILKNISNQKVKLLSTQWGKIPKSTTRMVQDIIEIDEMSVGVFRKEFWRYCQQLNGQQWVELHPLSPLIFWYEQEKRK